MALTPSEVKKLKRGDFLWVIKQHGHADNHFVGLARLTRIGTIGCALVGVITLIRGPAHPPTDRRRITATFAELVIPFE